MSYYVLNTNMKTNPCFTEEMLNEHKASAYTDPWNKKIDRLYKGDTVFLYQSRTGIVAYGIIDRERETKDRDNKKDEEYYVHLDPFYKLVKPMSAAKMRVLSDKCPAFRHTLYLLDAKAGERFVKEIGKNHEPIEKK